MASGYSLWAAAIEARQSKSAFTCVVITIITIITLTGVYVVYDPLVAGHLTA